MQLSQTGFASTCCPHAQSSTHEEAQGMELYANLTSALDAGLTVHPALPPGKDTTEWETGWNLQPIWTWR
jgi:hypothetical protein